MIVAALTGSIAMGKSETARMFAAQGIPVFDSDATVHELYSAGGEAVEPLQALVPSAVDGNCVNRQKLAEEVQKRPDLLKKVEDIVHPLVRMRQQKFLDLARASGADVVVLDIPLLFETGRESEVDVILVVSVDSETQRARALARPGMTTEKLGFILARQVPDRTKRAHADYVIDTSTSLAETSLQVERIVSELRKRARSASP
jgi:dephospho-CoA kinase